MRFGIEDGEVLIWWTNRIQSVERVNYQSYFENPLISLTIIYSYQITLNKCDGHEASQYDYL